ncbi:hypothetical protein D9758_004389 [Tetrapyrgos nigripes]|uniref:Uncharacterized protein n=1 Tax=Tetrapyrgos nigripes TaxID=182062 RepID=A0A8H5GN75_9AGAR|nr:hypothetical protein D9758_004389 [Tetrapyrgos nigripes]
MDDIFGGIDERMEPHVSQWLKSGQGLMAHNGIDVGIKLRPITEKKFQILGPEFNETWKDFYENAPDKAIIWSGMVNGYLGSTSSEIESDFAKGVKKCIASCYVTYYPLNIGHVHITSVAHSGWSRFDFNF